VFKIDFKIRKMQPEDTKHVQDVAKKSWNSTYKDIIPLEIQENFLKTAYNGNMMAKRLEQSYLFIAEVKGKIVGFANFSSVKEEGQIDLLAIYLYAEYQGQGIGSALLNEGIKKVDNAKEIRVNVEKDNHIGMDFYKTKGFEIMNEFDEDFNGHSLKTIQMVLKV